MLRGTTGETIQGNSLRNPEEISRKLLKKLRRNLYSKFSHVNLGEVPVGTPTKIMKGTSDKTLRETSGEILGGIPIGISRDLRGKSRENL